VTSQTTSDIVSAIMMRVTIALAALLVACSGDGRPPAEKPRAAAALTGWVESAAGRLRVEDVGEGGVPVLFVHGLGCDRHVWDVEVARLRASRRVLALDLHGFGESKAAAGATFGPEAHAADLLAVLDARGIARAVLVGHSYSGSVVLAFAGAHPDRTAGVVFVDSAPDLSGVPTETRQDFLSKLEGPDADAFLDKWFRSMLEKSAPGVKETVMGMLNKTDRTAFIRTTEGMWMWDPKPSLARFTGPRVAIVAEGPDATEPLAYHMSADFPHHVMTRVSHWLMLDRPDEFGRHLDTFLAGVK
jgi:pimeloyl-ACP methyl ester carboxylesterase